VFDEDGFNDVANLRRPAGHGRRDANDQPSVGRDGRRALRAKGSGK
jgi:hypothetical protein